MEKFIYTEWKFHNTNTLNLAQAMIPSDQNLFNLDLTQLKWQDHFSDSVRGVYKILIKETPNNLVAARKKGNM